MRYTEINVGIGMGADKILFKSGQHPHPKWAAEKYCNFKYSSQKGALE